jgi:hypothetical protein
VPETEVGKVNVPFALTVTVSVPLSINTRPVPDKPVTEPPTKKLPVPPPDPPLPLPPPFTPLQAAATNATSIAKSTDAFFVEIILVLLSSVFSATATGYQPLARSASRRIA